MSELHGGIGRVLFLSLCLEAHSGIGRVTMEFLQQYLHVSSVVNALVCTEISQNVPCFHSLMAVWLG